VTLHKLHFQDIPLLVPDPLHLPWGFTHSFTHFNTILSICIQLASSYRTTHSCMGHYALCALSSSAPIYSLALDPALLVSCILPKQISFARSLPGKTQLHKQIGRVLSVSLSRGAWRAGSTHTHTHTHTHSHTPTPPALGSPGLALEESKAVTLVRCLPEEE